MPTRHGENKPNYATRKLPTFHPLPVYTSTLSPRAIPKLYSLRLPSSLSLVLRFHGISGKNYVYEPSHTPSILHESSPFCLRTVVGISSASLSLFSRENAGYWGLRAHFPKGSCARDERNSIMAASGLMRARVICRRLPRFIYARSRARRRRFVVVVERWGFAGFNFRRLLLLLLLMAGEGGGLF